jgi:hypothetical protein
MVLFWHPVDKVVCLTVNTMLNVCSSKFAHGK